VWVYTKVPQTYFLLYWRRLTCEKVILTFIDSYCVGEVSVGLYQSSSDLFPIVLEKSVWFSRRILRPILTNIGKALVIFLTTILCKVHRVIDIL
jgi:hypothetical protein